MGTAGGVVLGFGRAHLSCYLDIQTHTHMHTHAHTCTLGAVCSWLTVVVWLSERDNIARTMTSLHISAAEGVMETSDTHVREQDANTSASERDVGT